jgi:hypothetical protein
MKRSKTMKSIKIKYKQRKLEICEREIKKLESDLNSAEVNLRLQKEKRLQLLDELEKLESEENHA